MAQQDIIELLSRATEPLPRREIAAQLGLNPKQVSRNLKQLVNYSIVSFEYKFDPVIKKKIWFYFLLPNK